jgi:hypothetical protein
MFCNTRDLSNLREGNEKNKSPGQRSPLHQTGQKYGTCHTATFNMVDVTVWHVPYFLPRIPLLRFEIPDRYSK